MGELSPFLLWTSGGHGSLVERDFPVVRSACLYLSILYYMNYFFELIRVALEQRDCLSGIPNEEEWLELYEIANRQALTGVLYDGVLRLPAEQRPNDVFLLKWYGRVLKIEKQNKKMNDSCAVMTRKFQVDGRRHVILKGQGVANLYPNPLHRISGDIDVWMEGERSDIVAYMKKRATIDHIVFHHLCVELRNNVSVEVHFIPSMMYSYFSHRSLMRFFKRMSDVEFNNWVKIKDNGECLPISTFSFNRVYLLVHIYRHLFAEGIGLRQLMDYYYLLKHGFTEAERLSALEDIKSLHMTKFLSAVMYVEQKVFGLPAENCLIAANEKEGELLLSEVLLAGNFGKYDPRIQRGGELSLWERFIRPVKRNMRFITSYPEEIISAPFFKIFHFCWLKFHGWI